jgi:predicted TIM-barrel fold metal-dependent hydrolase
MDRMRVIALEEHFWTPEIAAAVSGRRHPDAASGSSLAADLADLGERRLAAMDAAAIDVQVISHTTPGVQSLDPDTAVPLARDANDRLAAAVREHPDRFAGFATLPTPAPEAAADELERAVAELGFKGAMINGHTAGRFLDDPAFAVLLERAERLGVPLYLHPTEPVAAVREATTTASPPRSAGCSARPPGAGTPRPGCTSCGWCSPASSIATRGCSW